MFKENFYKFNNEENRELRKTFAIYIIVFFSGVCALIYEVVWMRIFLPVFGISIYSTTTVLCAFMSGLGLGSYLAPFLIKKWTKSLWELYALLNLGIGITAVTIPYSINFITYIYVSVSNLDSFKILVPVIRFALSFICMAIPTTFMGLTLPVLVQVSQQTLPENDFSNGKRIGWLYGLNTIGGAFGCILAGFILIYKLGLKATTVMTASLNVILGLAVFFFYVFNRTSDSRALHDDKYYKIDIKTEEIFSKFFFMSPGLLILLYAVIGASSLSYELIWTRILVFYLQGATYSYSIMLMIFLMGIGFGSLFFSRYLDKESNPKSITWAIMNAGLLQLFLGITALTTLHLYSRLGTIWKLIIYFLGAKTWTLITLQQIFIAGLIIFPSAFLMGIMFPLLAKLYKCYGAADSKTVGYLYAANTFGAVVGSFITGFVLFDKIGIQSTFFTISIINFIIGIVFLIKFIRSYRKVRWAVFGLIGIYILIYALTPEKILIANYEKYIGKILFYKETAADITIVHRVKQEIKLSFHDGRGASSTIGINNYNNRLSAYIPMLLNPNAKDILVICLGGGNTASAFSKFPIRSLDIVDISAGCFEAARYFYTNQNVLEDTRVRTYVEDGRNYLLKSQKLYDIISLEPPSIHTDGVVNLYTKEFYKVAYSKLKPGGILAQWIYANQSGREISCMLVNTMLDVFPNSTLWNNKLLGCWHVVGIKSDQEIRIDYEKTKKIFSQQAILDDMRQVNASFEDILSKLESAGEILKQAVSSSQEITDDLTIVDFYVPRLKRILAFGGGMAYLGAPLRNVFLRDWNMNKIGVTAIPRELRLSVVEGYEDESLVNIMDQLPEDVLKRVRLLRESK